jgi:hypothetical protein
MLSAETLSSAYAAVKRVLSADTRNADDYGFHPQRREAVQWG